MWYLVCPKKDGRSYRLMPDKKEHQVSRTSGDITLNGDQSVSRKHAVLTFETDRNGKTFVTIKDLASKYGTYVNESFKLQPNKAETLADGDVITFGCQWNSWRFHSQPLVVTSSNMPNEDKGKLRQIISELGGTVVGDWQESCSHLTMVEILLTAKVVCALASGIPIVTPDYWERFKEAIDEQKLPPSYEQFIPPLKESILNKNKVSFAINKKRRTLFSGKTFIFPSDKQLKKYKTIVVAAGGSCQAITDCELTVEELCDPDVIVMQHVANTDTQPSPLYTDVLCKMRERELKPIPESEIGLAVLMCSLDMYCNMKYNVVGNVLEGGVVMSQVKRAEVLADDSQMSVLEPISIKTEMPPIKTEVAADAMETTPVLSIMQSSSLSSAGSSSSRQWQNNQETLPCGLGETPRSRTPLVEARNGTPVVEARNGTPVVETRNGTPVVEPTSAIPVAEKAPLSLDPGPSRKRLPTIDIVEPPPKRYLPVTKVQERKFTSLPHFEDFIVDDDALELENLSNVNDEAGSSRGVAAKRKLDAMESDELDSVPRRKSGKVKAFSALFPEFGEGPSTSGKGQTPNVDWEEEEKGWQKDAEKAVKAVVSSDWGSKLKDIYSKRPGGLKDFSVGMTVKMAKLIVNDGAKKKVTETPIYDPSVINYKKFRKVQSAGGESCLPVIIGGSDLVPFTGGDKGL